MQGFSETHLITCPPATHLLTVTLKALREQLNPADYEQSYEDQRRRFEQQRLLGAFVAAINVALVIGVLEVRVMRVPLDAPTYPWRSMEHWCMWATLVSVVAAAASYLLGLRPRPSALEVESLAVGQSSLSDVEFFHALWSRWRSVLDWGRLTHNWLEWLRWLQIVALVATLYFGGVALSQP